MFRSRVTDIIADNESDMCSAVYCAVRPAFNNLLKLVALQLLVLPHIMLIPADAKSEGPHTDKPSPLPETHPGAVRSFTNYVL